MNKEPFIPRVGRGKDGEVFLLFPEWKEDGLVMSFGKYDSGFVEYKKAMKMSKPATEKEFMPIVERVEKGVSNGYIHECELVYRERRTKWILIK